MNDALKAFMLAVLGEDAFAALTKAGERSDALCSLLGPRTILGWVNLATRWDYDGFVPGLDDTSALQFTKSEHGITGMVALGEQQLDFTNARPEHLAAMLCVGLGCPPDMKKSEGTGNDALAKLGSSIDLMLTQRVVSLLKAEAPPPRCGSCNKFYSSKHKERCPHCRTPLEKAEMPGKAAAPGAPEPPAGAGAPTAKAPRRMATAKPSQVTMTKSMSEQKCSVCEAPQFRKGEFTGCFCLRELGRFAKSERVGENYLVTFGPEWSKKNVSLLMHIVGATDAE